MRCLFLPIALLVLVGSAASASEDESSDAAARRRAIDQATRAIAADPQDKEAYARRAALYASAGLSAQAIADYDRVLKLDPARADAYDARGSEHFKLGHIDASIADFDRFVKLRPDQEPWHWKRGISYYYAGRYDAGRRQFEGYQTVDDNDVENAVWRYLCMARASGVEAARSDMLKIKRDPRAGMMAVYDLYGGDAEPADVMRAARAGSPTPEQLNARLFYAHLYLGLYYETLGDVAEARRQLAAACQHKIGHYMWNVADVHAARLAAASKQ